jgi:hypothetical protein
VTIDLPVRRVEAEDADGSTYAFDVHPDIANSRAAGRHLAWLIGIGIVPPPTRVTLTYTDPATDLAVQIDPFGVVHLDGCPAIADGITACSFYCESEIREPDVHPCCGVSRADHCQC